MLTTDDHKLLHFEETLGGLPRWRKVSAIRQHLGLTETRYHQRLLRLVDDPLAVTVYPQVVYRVRGVNEKRVQERMGNLLARDE